jgi:hypothetical protein
VSKPRQPAPEPQKQKATPASTPLRPDAPPLPPEIGGRQGPEPTRYGDWEKDGRCIDF